MLRELHAEINRLSRQGVAAQGGALDLTEWRGVSYAAGGDAGAITVPNVSATSPFHARCTNA